MLSINDFMKNPSRKFIDLILSASGKWANWDPPHQIRVGDFGTVDKETGQLEVVGNIYEHPETKRFAITHPPEIATKEEKFIVSSKNVKHHSFDLGPQVDIAGYGVLIKGQWGFSDKRGALLIIHQPQSSFLPQNTFLEKIAELPLLKDKHLVTQVIACPAYSLYLSSAGKETVDVALIGSLPVPHVPGITVGGQIGAKWCSHNMTGLFREACDAVGSNSYIPLFTLKRIRKKGILRRDSPTPNPEGDDHWVNSEVPWDELDEDGEEDPYVEEVYD